MSVQTAYDDLRDDLRYMIDECLQFSKKLLDEDIWGYDEMKDDYAFEIYRAIKNIKKMI